MDGNTGIRERARHLRREGASYPDIGQELGIHPGLAYMVVTGVAADGSDGLSPEDLRKEGLLASSQHLANPRLDHPTVKESTLAFVRRRAGVGLDPAGSRPADGPPP